MRQVEERAKIATQGRQAEAKAQAASKLTNADVVAKIQASDCAPSIPRWPGLVALNEAGVSENVIIAMIATQ